MLEEWLREATRVAGGEAGAEVDGSLLSEAAVTAVLDLARHAAHGVERPAAPLAAFAVGLAIGRSGGGIDAMLETAARVGSLAREWAERPGGATGD